MSEESIKQDLINLQVRCECLCAERDRLKIERDEAADAFLHIKEAIAEMSFGVDLPEFFFVRGPDGGTYAVPSSDVTPFYDAIRCKLDVTPPSRWLQDCREGMGRLRIERDRLKAILQRVLMYLPTGDYSKMTAKPAIVLLVEEIRRTIADLT